MRAMGFTLVEVTIVVLILGILAAIAIPRFAGATDDARASALLASLGGVRTSIAAFRTRAAISGTTPFPTLQQLTAQGTVLREPLPANPFNGLNSVQLVSTAQATARAVISEANYGWNYALDNTVQPPTATFYANSSTLTTLTDAQGARRRASDL